MRARSVTFRLTLLFSTVSTAVLLVVSFLVGALVERHFIELDLAELNGKIDLVRRVLAQVGSRSDLDRVQLQLDDAVLGHPGLSISVSTPEGRVLVAPPGAVFRDGFADSRSETLHSAPGKPEVWEHDGHAFREIVAALPTAIAAMQPATVRISSSIDHEREFMAAFREILWFSITTGILLTGVLGWFAARRGLAPVRRIAALARSISASRLGERLTLDAVPAELSELVSAFNGMLARLEDSFRHLSYFSSDLAHELRTPVGNLVTETEVALSRARSADEYREVLYSNLEECNRLSRMIGDMLFLAKADNGLLVPRRERVDLAMQARELFAFYDALAEEKGVALAVEGAGTIQGDRLMIRRAMSNLLSNALRYTSRGSSVTVCIDQIESGKTRLAIENPADHIPPEHLPRLFDRFYRVDASRQKASDGAGLGLAITKSIVEAHQGMIAASSGNGVIRFEARFPPAGPA